MPEGTITFLFTDIEGSTTLWEQHTVAMQTALARHDALLRVRIEGHGGHVFKAVGDAVHAVFGAAPEALAAALAAQRALQAEAWPAEMGAPRVRMALHTGTPEARDGDYFGPPLNRAARLLAAGHGGQILLSAATYELVRDGLPAGVALHDLGQHRLKDLVRPEHIFQVTSPDLPATFPPLKTLEQRPHNLPVQQTSFLGRERELAEVVALLRQPEVHLLTFTGPGGMGKTRLALQAAAEVVDELRDGMYFVDLAPLREAGLVLSTLASTLGLRESGGTVLEEIVTTYLKGKELLLVLDNFEQVLAAALLVGRLLAACPRLTVLVTSRIVLRVYGEREYPVPPLALPPQREAVPLERLTQYAAVALFIERAQAARPDFQVSNATAPAVAEICARLDGLPLAIELAAARVRLLPPAALLARLENRLGMLTGGARTLPARQQTLRAAIDWSYELLSGEEQAFFARLSIFMGGRTLEAIEVVCLPSDDPEDALTGFDVLEGVASLVEKSLLRREDEGAVGEPCFVLLETLHEYACEALARRGETETLRARHATYFLVLAEEAVPQLDGPRQGVSHENQLNWSIGLEHMSLAIDNIRAALDYYISCRDAERSLRLAAAVGTYWHFRGGAREGRERLITALSLAGAGPLSLCRANALGALAQLSFDMTDYAAMAAYAREASDLYRSVGDLARASWSLWWLGISRNQVGDYVGARAAYEEELALARQAGDPAALALALVYLADTAIDQEDVAAATAFLAEGLPLARQIDGVPQLLHNLWNAGRLATLIGDMANATDAYQESLTLARRIAEPSYLILNSYGLAYLASSRGDQESARRLLAEGLTLARDRHHPQMIHYGLDHAAMLAVATGQPERAVRLGAACAALRELSHSIRHPVWKTLLGRAAVPIERPVADPALATAWDEGQALTLEQAVALALEGASPP